MATLYDASGKSYNVPHAVDVKDWLETGKYSLETKGKKSQKQTVSTKISSEEANKLFNNISSINAEEVKALANYLSLPYTTKDDTIVAIKTKLGR